MIVETVGDYIRELQKYPTDWPVEVATQAGGGIALEYREIKGQPCIAIFGANGGRFGENPLTEEEYKKQANDYLTILEGGYKHTTIHGDHRLYNPLNGAQATCFGKHFDRRVIERMIEDGLIYLSEEDIGRVRYMEGFKHAS